MMPPYSPLFISELQAPPGDSETITVTQGPGRRKPPPWHRQAMMACTGLLPAAIQVASQLLVEVTAAEITGKGGEIHLLSVGSADSAFD